MLAHQWIRLACSLKLLLMSGEFQFSFDLLGPVVQSNVSLTTSLRRQLVK